MLLLRCGFRRQDDRFGELYTLGGKTKLPDQTHDRFASDLTPLTPSESIAKVVAILGSGISPFVLDRQRCPETDKPRQCSALRLDLVRGLTRSLFYDRYAEVIFQGINNGLEELSLLAHQLKLLLKLIDPLLWSERFGSEHRAAPFSPDRRPLAPILPTMLTLHIRTVDRPQMRYRTQGYRSSSETYTR